jgi:hypothetical protein
MCYVDARYRGTAPDPATMQVVSLANVLTETGIVEGRRAVDMFNIGEFGAAASIFGAMQQGVSDADLRDLAGALAELSLLLGKWDGFLHLREPLAAPLAAVRLRLARSRCLAATSQPILNALVRLEMTAASVSQEPSPHAG